MLEAALDTLMDRTVVPGYTRIGYRARSRGFDALPRMDGRTVLVTGATSGLGLAAAEAFARLGAALHLVARSEERGERARARVAEHATEAPVRLWLCDMSLPAEVRDLGERVAAEVGALSVLVNNAGVLLGERTLTPDGIEATFATNVLGTFALTEALLGALAAGAPSRVITVSSGGMYSRRLDVASLERTTGDYDGPTVYAQTKRAQVVLTEEWARRHAASGVTFHAMHPGWADTPGVKGSLPRFHQVLGPLLRSPAEGADTIVWLGAAEAPARTSGGFWHDRRRRPTHYVPMTHEPDGEAARLWAACERHAPADAGPGA